MTGMHTAQTMKHLHDGCSVHDPCDDNEPETCPLEPVRQKRAAAKLGVWGKLIVNKEPGGLRHYLDGKPVHCGYGLLLQSTTEKSDDYGEYSVPLQTGHGVRYEASQDGSTIDGTLHYCLGGTEFVARLEPWMRFRWPGPERK